MENSCSKNLITVCGDGSAIVHLDKGYSCIVDEVDLEWIRPRRWRPKKDKYGYIYVASWRRRDDGKQVDELLHRLITNATSGQKVDHKNGNTLDNRRENLRVCSNAENIRNQKTHSDKKTAKAKGVYKVEGKYVAQIMRNYKKYYLGKFDTEAEAAARYKEAAENMHGDFARTT